MEGEDDCRQATPAQQPAARSSHARGPAARARRASVPGSPVAQQQPELHLTRECGAASPRAHPATQPPYIPGYDPTTPSPNQKKNAKKRASAKKKKKEPMKRAASTVANAFSKKKERMKAYTVSVKIEMLSGRTRLTLLSYMYPPTVAALQAEARTSDECTHHGGNWSWSGRMTKATPFT